MCLYQVQAAPVLEEVMLYPCHLSMNWPGKVPFWVVIFYTRLFWVVSNPWCMQDGTIQCHYKLHVDVSIDISHSDLCFLMELPSAHTGISADLTH